MAHITPNEIDIDAITFTAPKAKPTDPTGQKYVNMYYNKKALAFGTPTMNAPFGMADWEGTKFSIDLTIGEDHEVLLAKVKAIEARIIDEAYANSVAWLKNKYSSREIVENLFTSCIKYDTDKVTKEISNRYRPRLHVKLPFRNGAYQCDAYCNKELFDITKDSLCKGSKINAILVANVWLGHNKFGLKLDCAQLKLAQHKQVGGYQFIDDSDDENADGGDE